MLTESFLISLSVNFSSLSKVIADACRLTGTATVAAPSNRLFRMERVWLLHSLNSPKVFDVAVGDQPPSVFLSFQLAIARFSSLAQALSSRQCSVSGSDSSTKFPHPPAHEILTEGRMSASACIRFIRSETDIDLQNLHSTTASSAACMCRLSPTQIVISTVCPVATASATRQEQCGTFQPGRTFQ